MDDDSIPLSRLPLSVDQDTPTSMIPTAEFCQDFPLLTQDCSCAGVCNCTKEAEPHPSIPLLSSLSPDQYGSLTGASPASSPLASAKNTPANVNSNNQETSVWCGCHVKPKHNSSNRKAKIKLIIACIIALVFMIGEVIGGYFSHSLAIMTDAAHMLSDFASFLISLFSIWMATRPPSKKMPFGWHRAEVVGAVISVLIVWLVTGVLVYEAVMRIVRNDLEVDGDIMLITACVGLFVNVFMCMVLHQHNHRHSHSHSHSDDHSHNSMKKQQNQIQDTKAILSPDNQVGAEKCKVDPGAGHHRQKKESRNINVRAAFIHVIGDLVQSIGVVIAGYIISFKPTWGIVDPICTFIFSILVIISTINILRDAMLVLMEGAPRHIDTEAVAKDLRSLEDVRHVHSIHIWSLTMNKPAIAAHLATEPGADDQAVLVSALKILREKYGFAHTTLQVERFELEMDSCGHRTETTQD